eukprot:6180265-Pyramimonas_sp.AAC.1
MFELFCCCLDVVELGGADVLPHWLYVVRLGQQSWTRCRVVDIHADVGRRGRKPPLNSWLSKGICVFGCGGARGR